MKYETNLGLGDADLDFLHSDLLALLVDGVEFEHAGLTVGQEVDGVAGLLVELLAVRGVSLAAGDHLEARGIGELPCDNVGTTGLHDAHGLPVVGVGLTVGGIDGLVLDDGDVASGLVTFLPLHDVVGITLGALDLEDVLRVEGLVALAHAIGSSLEIDGPVNLLGIDTELKNVLELGFHLKGVLGHLVKIYFFLTSSHKLCSCCWIACGYRTVIKGRF